VSAGAAADWDRGDDGGYAAVPIAGHDPDEVREGLEENREGDYLSPGP
jgi:hypothetical protein